MHGVAFLAGESSLEPYSWCCCSSFSRFYQLLASEFLLCLQGILLVPCWLDKGSFVGEN